MPPVIDLSGQRFGRLVVIRRASAPRAPQVLWNCMCECGKEAEVAGVYLRTGKTQSCGCLQRECSAEKGRANAVHGESVDRGTPEYRTWRRMIERCEYPNVHGYEHYGGRGIRVCPNWRNDYSAFLADMGRKPSPGHSIDRIDNNKGYDPSNCRWATNGQQARNKRPYKHKR